MRAIHVSASFSQPFTGESFHAKLWEENGVWFTDRPAPEFGTGRNGIERLLEYFRDKKQNPSAWIMEWEDCDSEIKARMLRNLQEIYQRIPTEKVGILPPSKVVPWTFRSTAIPKHIAKDAAVIQAQKKFELVVSGLRARWHELNRQAAANCFWLAHFMFPTDASNSQGTTMDLHVKFDWLARKSMSLPSPVAWLEWRLSRDLVLRGRLRKAA